MGATAQAGVRVLGVASLAWIDIEVCRRCGGRLRVIASIEEPAITERILDHLHVGRAPPQGDLSL